MIEKILHCNVFKDSKEFMNNSYLIVIIALLPIAAGMLLIQANPFHALVIRGVLGALAALIEAILGAADVALTEALVGTLLAITLYAIAVRSSMVMRLAILEENLTEVDEEFKQFMKKLRQILDKHYLRLEFVPYNNIESLKEAFTTQEVHGFYSLNSDQDQITIRIKRLYDLVEREWRDNKTQLVYQNSVDLGYEEKLK
jgi:putative multicomponent Na+:H+ antiporter subunit B